MDRLISLQSIIFSCTLTPCTHVIMGKSTFQFYVYTAYMHELMGILCWTIKTMQLLSPWQGYYISPIKQLSLSVHAVTCRRVLPLKFLCMCMAACKSRQCHPWRWGSKGSRAHLWPTQGRCLQQQHTIKGAPPRLSEGKGSREKRGKVEDEAWGCDG